MSDDQEQSAFGDTSGENSESPDETTGTELLIQTAQQRAPELWGVVERLGMGPASKGEVFENALSVVQWIQEIRREAWELMIRIYRDLPPAAKMALSQEEWLMRCRYDVELQAGRRSPLSSATIRAHSHPEDNSDDPHAPRPYPGEAPDAKSVLLAQQSSPPDFERLP